MFLLRDVQLFMAGNDLPLQHEWHQFPGTLGDSQSSVESGLTPLVEFQQ